MEKPYCLRDLGLSLEVVGVERLAEDFRTGNGIGNLAMIACSSQD